MGVVRNRVESGKLAAKTNQSKRPDYYSFYGSFGGRAVEATKRAFSKIPNLASDAARKRFGINVDVTVQYVVRAADVDSYTASTREAARDYKRLLKKDKSVHASIYRIEYSGNPYDGAFIQSEKEVW